MVSDLSGPVRLNIHWFALAWPIIIRSGWKKLQPLNNCESLLMISAHHLQHTVIASHLLCKRIAPADHWLCKRSPFHSQLSPSVQTSLEWRIPSPKSQTHIIIVLITAPILQHCCFIKFGNTTSGALVLTFRWRLVGCMYWPRVRQSTLASRSSADNSMVRKWQYFTLQYISGSMSVCDRPVDSPVRVSCICWSVSPSPSMMDVLVSTVDLTFLACLRTLRDWSKLALGSRTCLETDGTDEQKII